MLTSSPMKVLYLVVLGVSAALLSSAISAQSRKEPQRSQSAARAEQTRPTLPRPSTSTSQDVRLPDEGLDNKEQSPFTESANPNSETLLAAFRLQDFQINAQGQSVFVAAKAEILDKRPNIRFFWSLRVTSGTDRNLTIMRRHYVNQLFTVPAEQKMNPTFSERFQLGPGDYRVELSIFQVPPGADITKADHQEWAQTHRIIGSSHRFTIADLKESGD